MKRALCDSVLDTIGGTPLIRLARVSAGLRTPVFAKAEHLNPGGSLKDRIGLAIIEDAVRRGELRPGGTIVEATSGNTGVALAMAAGAVTGAFGAGSGSREPSLEKLTVSGSAPSVRSAFITAFGALWPLTYDQRYRPASAAWTKNPSPYVSM